MTPCGVTRSPFWMKGHDMRTNTNSRRIAAASASLAAALALTSAAAAAGPSTLKRAASTPSAPSVPMNQGSVIIPPEWDMGPPPTRGGISPVGLPLDPPSSAPGYCPSSGGSTAFERISNVTVERLSGNSARVNVTLTILNPSGCASGSPCPSYDGSPEYVNGWIDWNNNRTWEPSERVIDAALSGYAIAFNSGQMNAVQLITIPENAVLPAQMRVNLGWNFDPNNPCTPSWSWGNVVDREVLEAVGISRVEALADVGISEVSGDTVWAEQVSPQCAVTPVSNVPVATEFAETGGFSLRFTLAGCPTIPPTIAPTTSVKYTFTGGPGSSTSTQTFSGASGDVFINAPRKVGRYGLTLEAEIKSGGAVLRRQTITIPTVYVLLGKPKFSDVSYPKVLFDKATAWAGGAGSASEVKNSLVAGIYTQGGFSYEPNTYPNWTTMVLGGASIGNCTSFSSMWSGMSRVLGVAGTSTSQHRASQASALTFLTTPCQAIGGTAGSASNIASGARDRWQFSMHQIGTDGSSRFYDPTVNQFYGSQTGYVETYRDAGVLDQFPSSRGLLRNNWSYSQGGVLTYDTSDLGACCDGLTCFQFGQPLCTGLGLTAQGVGSACLVGFLCPFSSPVPPSAGFVGGSAMIDVVDVDADTYFDRIEATILLDAYLPGTYQVVASLSKGGQFITERESVNAMTNTSDEITFAAAGQAVARVAFSGQDIRRAALNGPYTVAFQVYDGGFQPVAQASAQTGPLAASAFAELDASLAGLITTRVDDDLDGDFDRVLVTGNVEVLAPGDFSATASLTKDGTPVGSGTAPTAPLTPGFSTVTVEVQGDDVAQSGLDGPYRVSLQLLDSSVTQIDELSEQTPAWDSSDFAPPQVVLGFPVTETRVDTNANGRFEALVFGVPLNVATAGTFRVVAGLEGPGGEGLAVVSRDVALSTGTNTVSLSFAGPEIRAAGVNGPYRLASLTVSRQGVPVSVYENLLETAPYPFNQFESGQVPLVALDGEILSQGVDTNGNGLFNTLRFSVGVRPSIAGVVIVQGRLVSPTGQAIGVVSGQMTLGADQVGRIDLAFQGPRVFAALASGQFRLADLLVYHTGDPTQSIQLSDAHSTVQFDFRAFERWGDTNLDGLLNGVDFTRFQSAMASTLGQPQFRPDLDHDLDQRITLVDFQIWFRCYLALN